MNKQDTKGEKKKFECTACQHYVEMVVLGCPRCIKKFAPLLTIKQKEKIFNIIN